MVPWLTSTCDEGDWCGKSLPGGDEVTPWEVPQPPRNPGRQDLIRLASPLPCHLSAQRTHFVWAFHERLHLSAQRTSKPFLWDTLGGVSEKTAQV